MLPALSVERAPLRCGCAAAHFDPVFRYDAPPDGEVRFQFNAALPYCREVHRCGLCGHFVSIHAMPAKALYTGDYVTSSYGDDGIGSAFERITGLPPSRSDNVGRVRRILDHAARGLTARRRGSAPPAVLDVGSGLCVFLHRMKAAGWVCTALDTDIRLVRHAETAVGVRAVCGDFMTAPDLGRFDLITFNKVLEHVADPVGMLARSADHLREGGLVYVELPDGEAAVADGPGREEFFIEHLHVFSAVSLALLVERAGFALQALGRLREPSGKYTLWAFAAPAPPRERDGQP